MSNSEICQMLPWDSEFFGKCIARLPENRVDSPKMRDTLLWCAANRVDCLYFLCDPGDAESLRLAEAHRFSFVDIRLTLEARIPLADAEDDFMAGTGLRSAAPDDISVLRDIARVSHKDSRFYFDPHFERERCGDLYALWIEKSCTGWADVVLISCLDRQPVAYISCHRESDSRGRIGLVGVAPIAQKHGLGNQLVRGALRWFSAHDINEVSVVTQGRNVNAQRLYQRCGFMTKTVGIWFHRWAPFVVGESRHG